MKIGPGVGADLSLIVVSGARVSVISGVGVAARSDVGEGSGSAVHADRAAATAVHTTAVRAIRSHVFCAPRNALKETLIRMGFIESCAN